MLVKIKSKKDGSFTSNTTGDEVEYYWYKALRVSDDVTIDFGSVDGEYEVGEEHELNIEKTEGTTHKGEVVFRYKEVKTI